MKSSVTEPNPLNELKELSYQVRIIRKGDLYFGRLPELSLMVVDKDPKLVLEKLETLKIEYFTNMIAAGAGDDICLPEKISARNEFRFQVKVFLVKMLIVCILFGGTSIFVASVVKDKVASLVTKRFAKNVVFNFVDRVGEFADIPDAKYVAAREKFKEAVIRLRPLVDDVYGAFDPR